MTDQPSPPGGPAAPEPPPNPWAPPPAPHGTWPAGPPQAAYPSPAAYPPPPPQAPAPATAYPPAYAAPPPGYAAPPAAYAGPPPGSPWGAPPSPWQGSAAGPPAALPPLASWGDRVLATLVDALYQLPAVAVYVAGVVLAVANAPTTSSSGRVLRPGNPGAVWLGVGLALAGLAGNAVIGLYNHVFRQGRTGQTWGKSRLGLRLQHQDTGQVLGAGFAFLRQLAHVLDGVAYVGYLWPLWDPLRQTFADKVMRSVVVRTR